MGGSEPAGRGRRIAPKTTTFGIVARDVPTAVILRRGPTRYTRMLRWNLRDDTIVGGQWLYGRVEPGPCGLSPSGDLLVYEARKGARTFTAVCRPPYFTALAYWEYSAPWTGGGFFPSDSSVVLGLKFEDPYSAGRFPKGFSVTDVWSYFTKNGHVPLRLGDLVAQAPEAVHGWRRTNPGVFHKPHPSRSRVRLDWTRNDRDESCFSVVDEARSSKADPARYELGVADWADWAHDGTLLFGRGGELHRQSIRALERRAEEPSLVADLTHQSFERIVAPEAACAWPKSAGGSSKGSKHRR
jgi:hypothetical protein